MGIPGWETWTLRSAKRFCSSHTHKEGNRAGRGASGARRSSGVPDCLKSPSPRFCSSLPHAAHFSSSSPAPPLPLPSPLRLGPFLLSSIHLSISTYLPACLLAAIHSFIHTSIHPYTLHCPAPGPFVTEFPNPPPVRRHRPPTFAAETRSCSTYSATTR